MPPRKDLTIYNIDISKKVKMLQNFHGLIIVYINEAGIIYYYTVVSLKLTFAHLLVGPLIYRKKWHYKVLGYFLEKWKIFSS